MTDPQFDYSRAFYRNIGWFTETEQGLLAKKTVAIAGLGGVGGIHLLTLARLGIQNFVLAEFDTFEVGNFNRQVGATLSNLGQPKIEVLAQMAKDINPHCNIRFFPDGINPENINDFLSGVDVYIDGIDFFVLEARRLVFDNCYKLGIPAITAAPLGMGTAYMTFMPGKMSFEQYFGLEGQGDMAKFARFMAGVSPQISHRQYLMDMSRFSVVKRQAPSTMTACNLCAGVAAAEAIKILLKRDKIYAAPYYHLFDAYLNKHKRGYTLGGARNPLFLLRSFIIERHIRKIINSVTEDDKIYDRPIENLLHFARWAPSGENVQNWKFQILDDYSADIITSAIPADIYERNINKPSLISLGMLIETCAIVASTMGMSLNTSYRFDPASNSNIATIKCHRDKNISSDPLAIHLKARTVNRFPYQLRPLTTQEKHELNDTLGDDFTIEWYETFSDRLKVSKLNAAALDIHIRLPEEFPVLKSRIDFKNRYSPDRMPIATMPLNPLTRSLMIFATKTWGRTKFFNTYLGGTIAPTLEMAIIPGLRTGAHFYIIAKDKKYTSGELTSTIEGGRKLQRFWLTATGLCLTIQPSFANMCFSAFGRADLDFSSDKTLLKKSKTLAKNLSRLRKGKAYSDDDIIFAGRIGTPLTPAITSRSTRKTLEELSV